MALRVGINGFGRIGRCVLRAGINNSDIEFVGINDLTSNESLAYLLKYDSVHKVFDGTVTHDAEGITVNGKKIPISEERDPAAIRWKEWGADVVFESTGLFLKSSDAGKHLAGGAKFVILSAPAKSDDIKTIVYGVNHETLDFNVDKVISNASCTTNCLAPMTKVIDDNFDIIQGLMTTIHSYTNDQALLDSPHRKDLRRGRAAALSMVPTSTGAAAAVGKVLPNLKGKLDGLAIRVPTPNVSLTDLTCTLNKPASVAEVNAVIKAAAEGSLAGIIDYCEDPIVSIDANGNPHSCVFMPDQVRVMGNMLKVLAWYDNEWGYSNRMLDLARYLKSKTM